MKRLTHSTLSDVIRSTLWSLHMIGLLGDKNFTIYCEI